MCMWIEANSIVGPVNTPEFLEVDFCHPVLAAGTEPPVTEWDRCLAFKDGGSCSNSQCAWDKGIDLIPDHDYCAPENVNVDGAKVMQCTSF